MKNKLIGLCGIITCCFANSQNIGNSNCDTLILVSGWRSDNVHIYDGCDGSYIRNLAVTGLLDGPQAIFEDKNNDIVVVSESNHKLIKFDRQTLSVATVVAGPSLLLNPISAILDANMDLLLSSYSSNEIIKVETDNWTEKQVILPPSTQYLQGADVGNVIGPDGQLYIPGYDSDNIIKVNLESLEVTQVVPPHSGGLDAPRAIVFNGNNMFVTSERSNEIIKYDTQGQYIESFLNISLPAGFIKDGENSAIVISPIEGVVKINLIDASKVVIVPPGTGGIRGATFVYRIEKIIESNSETNAKQHWMIGVGDIIDNTIHVTSLTTTRNGDFGNDFNPNQVIRQEWGGLTIEFNACENANMSYQSFPQVDDYDFGNGGYELQKLASNLAGKECLELGMEMASNKLWMSGTWYGGANRSGEGFLIDVLSNNSAIVTWYTYLPKPVTP
jgi:hypothetical protein